MAGKCPVLTQEFEIIKQNHSTLASTGCTRDFCQAGRVLHTDEPRIGENRALSVVEQEAEDFLRDLRRDGFFSSEKAFQDRLDHVLYQIRASSAEGVVRETKERALVGGVWTQTPRELEFGLRRAWRNARKCIMRSHCEELRLCDMRSVTSSAKMAVELIKAVTEAFNDGNILPTVFVFPPRTANNRGPMIWNDQILMFAGYEEEDGSILGDPKNVQLTKEIIELGWEPPERRSRWDILPLVTMAEGDLPVIAELPYHLRKLVEIRHPKYSAAFEDLDLKWVAFPALSRLGFDIGGVQYTATPFIGWFMDAEIGVRNLADSFRYNVLPDVVKALRLDDGFYEDVDSFDDLPEYEKLAILSRAQAELNYAVQYSFVQNKITMSDSLTASKKWIRYDDEFQKKNGYRLPSDPFWVAPPQGSIIPLWHRGAAPNYQPKPMICRHVQDPSKAWKRELSDWPLAPTKQFATTAELDSVDDTFSLPIDSSISRTFNTYSQTSSESSHSESSGSTRANSTPWSEATLSPQMNAADIAISMKSDEDPAEPISLDTLDVQDTDSQATDLPISEEPEEDGEEPTIAVLAKYLRHAQELKSNFSDATLISTTPRAHEVHQGSLRVTINIGAASYDPLGCVQLLPLNADEKVDRVLQALGVEGTDVLQLSTTERPTYHKFLKEFADLELPFNCLAWLQAAEALSNVSFSVEELCELSVLEVIEKLQREGGFGTGAKQLVHELCFDMALLRPRTYSVASSLRFLSETQKPIEGAGNEVDILVKVYEHGRFSDVFLKDMDANPSRSMLKFQFVESIAARHLQQDPDNLAPIVAITTGAGFGPVRSLLQERISIARAAVAAGKPLPSKEKGVSLFVGLQRSDVALVTDILVEASSFNLIDMCFIVPSNYDKVRVHDKMRMDDVAKELRVKLMEKSAIAFVCTGPAAAKEIATTLEGIVGGRVKKKLGSRYVVEVF